MTTKTCSPEQKINCFQCQLGSICLPVALQDADIIKLDNIVKRGSSLGRNDHIYQPQDDFNAVFAIKSGFVKTYRLTEDGQEQVTGFYFPGEVFGLDGISDTKHDCFAKALIATSICEIPFNQFSELTLEFPELQSHFFKLMGQKITSDQQLITLLSKKSSEQKIATFLIMISSRLANREQNSLEFKLDMSRTDIANYLGLTVETVSRTFSKLNKTAIITLDQKNVTINDITALTETACLDN